MAIINCGLAYNYSYSYTKPNFYFLPNLRAASGFPVQRRRSLILVVSARCEVGLNGPLEPRSKSGRLLSGALLDDLDNFQFLTRKSLEMVAADRDETIARLQLSRGTEEACLHRRIAELKKQECQEEVEDIMYMHILGKFSEIKVHLIPRVSRCLYNGRLEILPSKDYELESMHSFEVLEMVREHISAFVGLRANANVKDSWATTKIQRSRICNLYAASILYGYFLKSASLRYNLEHGLEQRNSGVGVFLERFSMGSNYTSLDHVNPSNSLCVVQGSKPETLRGYVMGFGSEMIQLCARPKSKEAMDLIERHTCALFGDEKTGLLETCQCELVSTSFASLKRFVLEAVAFGSFLWETENYVDSVYRLEENV